MPPVIRLCGVVEVIVGIVAHTEAFHDAARAGVFGHGEGNDLVKPERSKTELEDISGGLGRKPVSPIVHDQTPTYFDARGEVRFEGRNGEADEADKRDPIENLDGP